MSIARTLLKPIMMITVAVLLLITAGLIRNAADDITGPLAIAVHDNSVTDNSVIVVAAPGQLYYLNGTGALQYRDDATLAPAARDAGLAFIGDTLLVSPGIDGALQRCTNNKCTPFSADPYAPTSPVQIGPAGTQVWLSETGSDRLYRFRHDGRRIDVPLSDLAQPGTAWQQDDQLLVCNTGGKELLRYTLHKRGISEPDVFATWSSGDENTPIDRPLRLLALDHGKFQVLFTNATRSHGLIANVDANGSVQPLDVPGLVNPVALDALGSDTLVVDEDRMQILRITADGKSTVFGDAAFTTQLAAKQPLRDRMRMTWPLLLILAALAFGIGIAWLLHRLLMQRPDTAPLPVPKDNNGIAWLPPVSDQAPSRMRRQLLIAAPAALAPVIAMMLFGLFEFTLAGIILAVVIFAVAAVWSLHTEARREQRPGNLRIGLHDAQLVVADTERGLREYPLQKVLWDEQQLQPEPLTTVPLTRDGIDLFHRPTLTAVLFPRLDPRCRITGQTPGQAPASPLTK